MKKNLVIILMLVTSAICYSQKDKQQAPVLVQVTNWGQTFMMISDNFWNKTKDDLIKQLGVDGFEKARLFSKEENMPRQMVLMSDATHMKNAKEFFKKMCSLRAYKVAAVRTTSNDKGDVEDDVLIMIPYAQNKSWDPEAKWDTVYFLVKAAAVTTNL